MTQLAQLLPMEENFLLLFRFDNPLDSSVEFMKVSEFRILHFSQAITPFHSSTDLARI